MCIRDSFGVVPRLVYHRAGYAFPLSGPSGRMPMFAVALLFALPLLMAQWRRRDDVPPAAFVALAAAFAVLLAYVVTSIAVIGFLPTAVIGLLFAAPMAAAYL